MKKVLGIFTNKFLLTAIAFTVWMAFFDQNDWPSQVERKEELEGVNNNIAYLTKEIAQMEEEHSGITSDPRKLEEYAREHYHMKKDNEDLYLIEK